MAIFDNAIMRMQELGVDRVILPFILIFTVIYAILDKVRLFETTGKEGSGRRFNVIISLAIALLVVIPHVMGGYGPLGYDPIDIITNILPGAALIIVTIVVVLIVAALVTGMDAKKLFIGGSAIGTLIGLAALIGIAAVVVMNIYPAFLPPWATTWLQDESTQSVIIMIAIFGLIIWFVTSEPKSEKKPLGKVLKEFGEQWG